MAAPDEVPGLEGEGIDANAEEVVHDLRAMILQESKNGDLSAAPVSLINEGSQGFHDGGVGVIEGVAGGRGFRVDAQDHLGQGIEIDIKSVEEGHKFVTEHDVGRDLGDEVNFKAVFPTMESMVLQDSEGLSCSPQGTAERNGEGDVGESHLVSRLVQGPAFQRESLAVVRT